MPNCYNCGKPAIVILGDGIPLCLDCYERIDAINQRQVNTLAEEYNHLADMAEMMTGVYGTVPRYKINKPIIQRNNVTYHNINVDRSVVGVINSGDVKRIDLAIDNIKYDGNEELANMLKNFTEAVIENNDINNEIKNSVLENVAFLSAQANISKEKRQKGIIKSILSGLKDIIVCSAALTTLWDNLNPVLQSIFT